MKIIDKIAELKYEEPCFCFTSDVDWASEAVIADFLKKIEAYNLNPTIFVTHKSEIITEYEKKNKIELGIHPNFLRDSSQGKTFQEVVETCISLAPKTKCYRSHRAFDVTDVNHLLKEKYGFKYSSNYFNVFGQNYPMYHESGLINFPIFFEDGTHLYNRFSLNFESHIKYFQNPGLKIISFHPMNFIFNSHSIAFMRKIKDELTRDHFSNINNEEIFAWQNHSNGIRNYIISLIEWVLKKGYKIKTLNELYNECIAE